MLAVLTAFGLFFVLLALGTPIFVGVFIGAGVGLFMVQGWSALWTFFTTSIHAMIAQYFFAVIPMFILVGMLADSGGMGVRAYNAFHKLVGHVRGGLLITTIFAAAAFGACSGSSVASAALFAKVSLPELKKFNYAETTSLGAVATAGSLAVLIPPSAAMVIYGVLTNTSVGRMLIGGIVPGILLSLMLVGVVMLMVRLNPGTAPMKIEPASWKERLKTPLIIWPLVAVFLIIIVSIWTGLVTPSEAGALGSLVMLLWNLIIRVPLKKIGAALFQTAVTTSQIMILIVGGLMLSKVVIYSRITVDIIEWIRINNFSLAVVWMFIVLIWLILGMIIDPNSQLVLTLPLIYPVMTGLGVDPVALGIVAIVMIEVAVITPPVGFNCYVVASIAEVDPGRAFRGIMPFFATLMAAVVVFISFPILSTWLPTLAFG
ncbi:MAG: TRAP transporter large permease [Chloroflexi bacterium]|nr:TRAP transporter large permease [Chloroflexota bacterium]